jgi:outer membrane protein assembly factor BamD (BamD/ComL family)
MKPLIFLLLASLFLCSCKEKPVNPAAEYGDAMLNSYQKGKQATETGNLDAVRSAVQAYHAAHDRYPQNLEEIKGLLGSELDFSKYDYDPQNGTVNVKNK